MPDVGGSNTGTYQGTHSNDTSTPIACPNDTPLRAYAPNGSTDYVSTSTVTTSPPTTFSTVIWFKTTAPGGYLIGFGANATGGSGAYDRHLYVTSAGKIAFGTYNGGYQMVTSPQVYNDGVWHMAAGTMSPSGGMTLYVDGRSVGTNPAYTAAQAYNGYWRIGYHNIGVNWPGSPAAATPATTTYFAGSLRYAAAYATEFSPEEIAGEYRSGLP